MNKTVLTFIVKVDVQYDNDKSLKEAMKDIRENLHVECMSFGDRSFNLKSRKPRLARP